ncbi:hypothetical protein QL992_04215 [Microbacterium sp. APC 3898]|uniref:Uncharacterized protein n=1 Tax=Planococcus notacanthi TaxID=3035188 RepID=A0ABT7ZLM0_9BACL|nr:MULTISPECIES: hypothetical protein [Terrabacteria group]MDN3428059.1 hypothetical protein [Planococcus sp. APC 4016]MDN3438997.1 hypothetical protein [Planococcus sp. APC 3900]MDN3498406.1 hypothetical protein [Microbacterium sp. APC 3898]
MKRRKIWIVVLLLAAAVLLLLFFMPRENVPAPESRVILEHSFRTYIAPSCFEEADATNFLEESTLAKAQELEYPPHSSCTEEAFEGNRDSGFIRLMKELGVMEKESKDW